ncbi:type II secretion system protein [Candidatus Wolfebacteria bacterium]|nr:type II secretion system protein [Candidatus Wolfebacteria bacterium]
MKGFTVFELLIAIAILAVVSGFTILNLFGYRRYQDVNLTGQEIAAVLRNAQNRSLAQESGAPWGVHFENSTTGDDYYELFSGSSYTATSAIYSTTVLRPTVEFSTPVSGSNKNVRFAAATGFVSASEVGEIRVSLKGSPSVSSTIYVNANGRIDY